MDLKWHIKVGVFKLAVYLLKSTGWYDGYWNHWRSLFTYAQSKGLHIMPVHFYSPIPDTQQLREELWAHRAPVGFNLNLKEALELLHRFGRAYGHEYQALKDSSGNGLHRYSASNEAYASGDAEVLYGMVRDLKPARIIEIGSGHSTLLIADAIRANIQGQPDYRCEFTAIEPYPPAFLSPPPPEVTRIDSRPLQEIDVNLFSSLGNNDILFIDSTHVARIGSDVVLELLTIVPRVAPGVVVHIHDIFMPSDYPRWWIDEARFFWNEQYLVSAFLAFNEQFKVIMATHALWLEHGEKFRQFIPTFDPKPPGPSSFWIRRLSAA